MKLRLAFLTVVICATGMAKASSLSSGEETLFTCQMQDRSVNNMIIKVTQSESEDIFLNVNMFSHGQFRAKARALRNVGAATFSATFEDGAQLTLAIATGAAPRKVGNKIVHTGRVSVAGAFENQLMDCSRQ